MVVYLSRSNRQIFITYWPARVRIQDVGDHYPGHIRVGESMSDQMESVEDFRMRARAWCAHCHDKKPVPVCDEAAAEYHLLRHRIAYQTQRH